jgi:hypothetical protein
MPDDLVEKLKQRLPNLNEGFSLQWVKSIDQGHVKFLSHRSVFVFMGHKERSAFWSVIEPAPTDDVHSTLGELPREQYLKTRKVFWRTDEMTAKFVLSKRLT